MMGGGCLYRQNMSTPSPHIKPTVNPCNPIDFVLVGENIIMGGGCLDWQNMSTPSTHFKPTVNPCNPIDFVLVGGLFGLTLGLVRVEGVDNITRYERPNMFRQSHLMIFYRIIWVNTRFSAGRGG